MSDFRRSDPRPAPSFEKPGSFAYVEANAGGEMEVHAAFSPDMASLTDQPHEIMAEEFGIPLVAARRIMVWHLGVIEREAEEQFFRKMQLVIGHLIQPKGDLLSKVWGLAFSFGLASRTNGVRNMSLTAKGLGCTRALLSHYKRFWDRELWSTVRIFGKAAASCERMRVSRLEFVRTGKTKKERSL